MDVADLTSAYIAGAAAGDLTVTGIALYDELILVQDLTNGKYNAVSEYTITAANTINNTGGTSTNGHSVLVVWKKNYGTRNRFDTPSTRQGRSPF